MRVLPHFQGSSSSGPGWPPRPQVCVGASGVAVRTSHLPVAVAARPRRRRGTRPVALLKPLPLAVVAAGAGELAGGARRPGVATLVNGGALVASARRPAWRLPLLTVAIGLRAVGLIGRRPSRVEVLWLAALAALRRELARAEAWDTPLSR